MRLASEPCNTQSGIEGDLGINQGSINRWKRELCKEAEQAFSSKGHLKLDDDEMRRLKRENERLRSWSVEEMCRTLSVSRILKANGPP